MLPLDDLAVFERVVREGSYTAAARALGLSKSSVSEKVSRLEHRLGVRLLQRSSRKLGLTDLGRLFHQHCERVVAEVDEAERAVTSAGPDPTGTLRLTAPTLFGDAFLTPIVSTYLARYPAVRVELLLCERSVDLIAEGFDLAIRIGALSDSSLQVKKLGQARSIFVASRAYLATRGCPETPDALSEHDCIEVGHGERLRWPYAGPDGPGAVAISGRFAVNSLLMGRDAAIAGAGVAWLPTFVCQPALASGDLVEVLAEFAPPPYAICAVYPTRRLLAARVRAFIDLLVEHTRDDPPWAAGF